MIISFDLDGVLFVDPVKYEIEPPLRRPFDRFYPDRLRKGTVELIHRLQDEKFKVWVYTPNYYSQDNIRRLFRHYHVSFDKIINGYKHDKEVQRNRKQLLPSKLPNFYRISLHIDDETVICSSAGQYGFRAYQLYAQDDDWKEKIIARADQIRKLEHFDEP